MGHPELVGSSVPCPWGHWDVVSGAFGLPQDSTGTDVAMVPKAGGDRQGCPFLGSLPLLTPKSPLRSYSQTHRCLSVRVPWQQVPVGWLPAQGWRKGCRARRSWGELQLEPIVFKQAHAKQFKCFDIFINSQMC